MATIQPSFANAAEFFNSLLRPTTLILLADAMVMDRATLGHNLRPLETQGYVKMSVGADRRSREVSLTPTDRKILTEAQPLWKRAQDAFEKEIGAEEAAMIRSLMHHVAAGEFASA